MRTRLGTLFAGLGQPAYRRIWSSQVISEVGDWAARLALITVVYTRTGSAEWASLLAVVALLPMLGPAQLAATVADRIDRRVVMVGADVVRAALFAFLGLIPSAPLALIFLVAIVAGFCTVPFESARSAAVIDVTPPQGVSAAVSLGQATQSLAVVIGWAVGGVLVTGVGAAGALLVNAATFVVSGLLLMGLPALRPSAEAADGADGEPRRSATRSLLDAAAALTEDPVIRRAAAIAIFAVAPAFAVQALVVPYAAQAWGLHSPAGAVVLSIGAAAELLLVISIPTELAAPRQVQVAAIVALVPALLAVVALGSSHRWVVAAGFITSTLSSSAIAPASAALAPRLPAHLRASCFTVLGSWLTLANVLLLTGGGAVADASRPALAARLLLLLPVVAGVAALLLRVRPIDIHPVDIHPGDVRSGDVRSGDVRSGDVRSGQTGRAGLGQ